MAPPPACCICERPAELHHDWRDRWTVACVHGGTFRLPPREPLSLTKDRWLALRRLGVAAVGLVLGLLPQIVHNLRYYDTAAAFPVARSRVVEAARIGVATDLLLMHEAVPSATSRLSGSGLKGPFRASCTESTT